MSEFKVGSFQSLDGVTGTQAVTGLGFTPKAIIFWMSGSDQASGFWDADIYQSIGFTSGPTESYSVGGSSQDAQSTSNTGRSIAAAAIETPSPFGTASRGQADLVSFDADGFTLDWTVAPLNWHIMFLAIGGDGVEAKVVNWTSPTSVGNKAVTGVGFQPDVVLHAHSLLLTTVPSSGVDMGMNFGAMDAAGNQWANAVSARDNQATSETHRYQRTDRCLTSLSVIGSLIEEAEYVSMDVDGFTTNFTTANGDPRQQISLCLSGVDAKVGDFAKTTDLDRIDTSTAATATAYSNQRKIDRCQNGVLWASFHPGTQIIEFWYSTDDGTTFTDAASGFATTSGSGTPDWVNYSFFIDLDDYAHVVYKSSEDGYIYYRRGTPNAARTAWTWSAAEEIYGNTLMDYCDIVAHKEGTGWVAHIVLGWVNAVGEDNITYYKSISISSGGAFTVSGFETLGGSYFNGTFTYPSIDFNHTGDGKTVKDGAPHLFVAWSAGATGAGLGIRFKKATYSGGSWTWGTEREIDSTRYVINTNTWLNCLFDGTRIIIGGMLKNGTYDICLYERDAADTTTITHVALNGDSTLYRGTMSYDGEGNIFLLGVYLLASPWRTSYYRWVRATSTLEALVITSSEVGDTGYLSAKRGFSNSRIEFIYTDGSSSPYDIKFVGIDETTGEIAQQGVKQEITGVGFEPKAVLLSNIANTPTTSVELQAIWNMGASDGPNERSVAQADRNGQSTTVASSIWKSDKAVVLGTITPAILAEADLASLDANGFTLDWTINNTAAYEILYISFGVSNVEPNVPTAVARTGLETDTTPNFSAEVTDPDVGDQVKARFELSTKAGVLIGTVESSFRTGNGTVTAEYASALAVGEYRVRAKSIDAAGMESVYSSYVDFRVTQSVSPISRQLIWNVRQADIFQRELLWNITVGNQKDFELLWNVRGVTMADLILMWNAKTPWTRVTDNETDWTRVYE